ncbi:MAG TPA: fibronectin type III domain-containing protein, partial [Streptosporangiaceae bacterium]
MASAVEAILVGLLLAGLAVCFRRGTRLAAAAVMTVAGLAVSAPAQIAAASSTTLFAQSFSNNTVNSTYPVSVPAPSSGETNSACLTASGNTSSGVLHSCPTSTDPEGSGNLRLTAASGGEEGGVFSAASVPTSEGIDATFNTYQYGGTDADGIAFALAAVNPANPVSPANIGHSGGALGYSANAVAGEVGLADGYLGIGLDVYGNYSTSAYEGTGCTNPPYISTTGAQVPGQVVVRGPGNGTVGYCAVNSSATSTSSKALALRASTRTASEVPVEVAINPTAQAFTTASGLAVAADSYVVAFTPAGGSLTKLSGTLPTVPAGLYPSSWVNSTGFPQQLAFGWVGSTGAVTDFHEVDAVNVVSFNPVPQLTVAQTSYSAASPATGAPVTYTVSPGVSSSGTSEPKTVSVSETLPAGVTPVGAYGSGWTCAAPSGQVITCTDSSAPFAAGTSLPVITVEGIVTGSGVTASKIQSGTTVTASSSDGIPGIATSTTAGTLPSAPSGITLTPSSGTIAGGNAVTISGTSISGATAIEIGTTAQQQAGTPVVLLPCPSGAAPGCFTVSGSNLSISSMPAVTAAETVNVTVVTLGVAGAASYVYQDKPGTPAAPTATAGITSATVTWVAPASNDSPITGYVVTPFLNGVAQTPLSYDASTTTRTLTGLTAGASYTFTVAAVNAVGTGPASPQSNAVVPFTLPGAPAITAVSAGDAAASVSWSAPASNGGSAITGYVVTPYIAGVAQTPQTFSSTATTQTATGLTPGTSYTFTVAAVNAAGTGPASAQSAAVTVNAGPSLTFSAPPAGEAGIGYSDPLTATGGTGALTWSVSSGSLPAGLSLNSGTGLLSGTPAASGSSAFTVKVTDTTGHSATKAVTLVIAAAPSLSNPAPPAGQASVSYSDALTVTGGTGPFAWSVSGGGLPPGITLNSATGTLSGVPATAGLYSFTVRVTDSFGLTATQGLNLTVAVGPLVIAASANTNTAAQGGIVRYTVTITNTAASAYTGVTYSIPLTTVLQDTTYNNDAAATAGTVSVASQTLTWTGTLAAGASATVTFSVTVNNPYTGNGTLSVTVTSATTGTNCPAGSTDARCSVSIPVSAVTIVQSSTVTAAAPGAVVHFTITVTNSGAVSYTGVTFTDPLGGMLDDASYDADAAASSGTVSVASQTLTWTGSLAPGAVATITFSATVNNPDTGNKILTSTVTSATTGSNCPAGGTDPRCTITVAVQALTISSTASTATATPGATVSYTITVTNTGQASYTGASISDSLTGVLDDATYNGDGTASAGSLSYISPTLTWTGSLTPGATATITFSATVKNPDTGNKTLVTAITSPTPASNCPASGPAPACGTSVAVLVPALTIAATTSSASTVPGATVSYTITITNTGQTPYTGITVTDDLSGLLDDAGYNGDAAASVGAVSFTSPTLTWTGTLATGAAATVTFSVTVNTNTTGDQILTTTVTSAAPGSNCPAGSTDPRCVTSVPVLISGLDLTVTANAASAAPGSTVNYTVLADNTGQTTDTGVSFTAALAGVLDDAAYNGDAATSVGAVSFTSPDLTWTGTLAAGAVATITFSVTLASPDTGDHRLTVTLTSTAAGNTCAVGSTDPSCFSAVTVSSLAITNNADVTSTTPGGVVRFTATFTNTGQTPYNNITIAT